MCLFSLICDDLYGYTGANEFVGNEAPQETTRGWDDFNLNIFFKIYIKIHIKKYFKINEIVIYIYILIR